MNLQEYKKDFETWNKIKKEINDKDKKIFIKDREIWWCSVGVNVGVEIDGKNFLYERPVLVLKKFNKKMYAVVPITSTNKVGDFSFEFDFNKKTQSAILSQSKMVDVNRFSRKISTLNEVDFFNLKNKFLKMYKYETPLSGGISEAEAINTNIVSSREKKSSKNLRGYISDAAEKGVAVGHFNFSTYDVAWAIIKSAKELDLPVILGLSEAERGFTGVSQAAAFVRSVREDFYEKVFLNADHTYSFERVREAVEAGFDMVIFDGASGDEEKNIQETNKCREFINNFNKENNCDVLLEAELGYIGKSSKVMDELPDGLQMTTVEDAKTFVDSTKVDMLAPAIGNVHGMLKSVPDPDLDTDRAGEIFRTVKIPLVLHGASGNSKDDIQAAIRNGVAIVHVNTEIRVSYLDALKNAVNSTDEVAPYKYLQTVQDSVKATVTEKLKIFNFID